MTVGRPKKAFSARFHQIPIVNDNGIMLKEISIQIRCPLCKSEIVSTNGTRKTMKAREIIYQCKNPGCTPRTNTKRGKQFSVYTSYCFVRYTDDVIGELKDKIMHSSTTHTNIKLYFFILYDNHRSITVWTFHIDPDTLDRYKFKSAYMLSQTNRFS